MAADVIDWELALTAGGRLAPTGPKVSLIQARETVARIRQQARAAVDPVRECTGLISSEDSPQAAVVDRKAWIQSNLDSFQFVLSPVLDRMRESTGSTAAAAQQIGSRVTALQLGGVLAWLSGKVLGQYEALAPVGSQPRLMLVAPNIAEVADLIAADPDDFQMWVCLHEETHRVQFTAVPWLADHLLADIQTLLSAADTPAREYLKRTGSALATLPRVIQGKESGSALLRAFQSPEQLRIFDRVSAVMTLLEGHADFVMDQVGPEIVPTVASIRDSFNERREHPGAIAAVVRRVFGLDAKLRQYTEGAHFVRTVVGQIGMADFNEIWGAPDRLPNLTEIADPMTWVRRVHG